MNWGLFWYLCSLSTSNPSSPHIQGSICEIQPETHAHVVSLSLRGIFQLIRLWVWFPCWKRWYPQQEPLWPFQNFSEGTFPKMSRCVPTAPWWTTLCNSLRYCQICSKLHMCFKGCLLLPPLATPCSGMGWARAHLTPLAALIVLVVVGFHHAHAMNLWKEGHIHMTFGDRTVSCHSTAVGHRK